MNKFMKKAVALAAVAAMTMTAFTGCASSIDNSAVVATVGEKEISAGLANFYARYEQASVESYYGSMMGNGNIWTMEVGEGNTYEDSLKDQIMNTLHEIYVLDAHAEELGVALTEEETAKIDEAAKAFCEDNTDKVKKMISGDLEIVKEYLRVFKVAEKVTAEIVKDVDTKVSDEEAAQKRLRYVSFAKTVTDESGAQIELTADELAAVKKDAEAFLAGAKANGSLEAYAKEKELEALTLAFDAESTTISADFIKAMDALAEKDFSEVFETESAYYVAQLETLFDEEATEAEKENIVATRKNEKYTEVVKAWMEEMKLTVNEEVWSDIKLKSVKITVKQEETEK